MPLSYSNILPVADLIGKQDNIMVIKKLGVLFASIEDEYFELISDIRKPKMFALVTINIFLLYMKIQARYHVSYL